MNRIDLDNFYSVTSQLARTMVVKLEAIAQRDNDTLEAAGYEVGLDKTTWRYYMNLAGDYHATDSEMSVISLDTGKLIVFNKENLTTHLLTRRGYLKGGDLYKRLVAQYPSQSVLINGILFPIAYDVSINAKNYKILRYNQDYVLWNEEQLIPAVQQYINAEAPAMFESEYHVTEDLMLHQMVVELSAGILKCLHLTRFQAIKTRYAHDFYIWSHIDSYGNFSIYKSSLTNTQTMWLHKNIEWLSRNAGQSYTLERMIVNLLTPRNIPIMEYDLVLNTESQIKDLYPTPSWRRTRKNLNDNNQYEPEFFSTEQLITKEASLATDNRLMFSIYENDADYKATHSLHTDIPTKVLESQVADFTNRHNDSSMTVAFNEWIYLASQGIYNISVSVSNPKDGRVLRMNANDAFVLWRYLTQAAQGNNLLVIEAPYYQNVMRLSPPSIKGLQDIGGGVKYVTDKIAETIREQFVTVTSVTSAEELMSYALDVYNAMWQHKKLYSQYGDVTQRSCVKTATTLMYQTGLAKITDETSYDTFLGRYALDFAEYTSSEMIDFAWTIFKTATGWDLASNPTMRSIQSDLIDLMMTLSSYTIHTVKTIDDGVDVTEMPVNNMIGNSDWIGLGHGEVGDFSGVQFKQKWDPRLYANTETTVVFNHRDRLRLETSTTIVGRLPDSTNFRRVITADDRLKDVFKIPNSSYIAAEVSSVPSDGLVLPGTYYGNIGKDGQSTTLLIPPTYYGVLQGKDIVELIIPPTYYGTVFVSAPNKSTINFSNAMYAELL